MSGKGFAPKGSGFTKKRKSSTPKQDPESGYSKAYAQLLGVLSEGEIEGPIGGLKSVYLNETPIQNSDDSLNFTNVGYQFRPGSSDQSPVPGFGDDIVSEVSIGSEVKFNLPITRQIINPNLDLIRVRLAFQLQEFPPDGGYRRLSIAFRILIREGLGGFVVKHEQTIDARFSSPVELEFDFPVNNQGGTVSNFAVRVERLTPQDTDTTRYQRVLNFRAYGEVIATRLSYPYSALVGLQFDAAQFDSLPQAAFKIGGRLIKIPSNAVVGDDRGLDYFGAWDGTFVTAPIACACPAWIFYDLVTNKRYGLGKYIDASKVDKWSIYELSQYCNELIGIGEGYGSSERRFQCHVLLENKEDAIKVIDALRSIFRGFTYWMNGALHISADRPGEPAMIVTQADIQDGMFSYNRTPLRQRHTVAMVTWLDPENFYKRAIETVEDAIGIERYGLRELEFSAFGCTSRYQAHRAGWAAILSERLELETVRFRLRPYGAYAVPGMVIKVMDVKRSIVRFGGLVVESTPTTITIDHPVTFVDEGENYLLTFMLPDGEIVERNVNSTPGTRTVLTDFGTFDPPPVEGSPWILSSVTVKPQLYRIIGVVPVADEHGLLYEISALEYRPEKYEKIDTDYYVPPLPPRPTIPAIPNPPTDLTATLDDNFSSISFILSANWRRAENDAYIVGYLAEYRTPGGEWQGTQQVGFPSASWDVPSDTYYVRVSAIDVDSGRSGWVEFGPVTVVYAMKLQLGISAAIEEVHEMKLKLGVETAIADQRPGIALSLAAQLQIGTVRQFSPTIASLQGSAGLTQLINTTIDDSNQVLPALGFDFPFFGATYNDIYVGSNSYITFGFSSSGYSNLSATNPGRGLLIAAADRSYSRLWAGAEGGDDFRIRFEGNSGTSGSGTSLIWEVTLFSDGVIMLVTGAIPSGGTSLLSNGTTGLNYAIASNSSFVFIPSGNTYTIQQGSYG